MSRARTNANNWAADITEVTAGTGITVTNGTGPAPTVTNSMATAIDAKGDILVGTGDNTFSRLGVGTNAQVLTVDSSTTTGLIWATPQVGDITAVNAGTGISGGGTTGDVTITNAMATAIDAKGDLIAGTADNAFARLAVGTNGQILTADSTTATGLRWAAPAGGGKILQVVMGSTSTQVLTSTNTPTDTGLSATITPSSTASRVLVMVTHNGCRKANTDTAGAIILIRNSTTIATVDRNIARTGGSTTSNGIGTSGINFLDTPATTSAITYKTQQWSDSNSSFFMTQDGGTATSTMILLEVGA